MFPLIREIHREVCPQLPISPLHLLMYKELHPTCRLRFVHDVFNTLSKEKGIICFNGDIGARIKNTRIFSIDGAAESYLDEEIEISGLFLIDPSDFLPINQQQPTTLDDLQALLKLTDQELKIYLGNVSRKIQSKEIFKENRSQPSCSEKIDDLDLASFKLFLKFIQNKEKAKQAIKYIILHELGHIYHKHGPKRLKNSFLVFIGAIIATGLMPYMITFSPEHASFVKKITALLAAAFVEYRSVKYYKNFAEQERSRFLSKGFFFAHWGAVGSMIYLISRNPDDLAPAKKVCGMFFSIYFLYEAVKKLAYPILFYQSQEYEADLFAAQDKAVIEGGIYLFSIEREKNQSMYKQRGTSSLSFWKYLENRLFYNENGENRLSFLSTHPLPRDRIKALNKRLENF